MTRTSALLVVISVATIGCLADVTPEVGQAVAGQCKNEDTDPDFDVSFSEDVLPLLQAGCRCHDPAGRSPFAIGSTGFSIGSHAEVLRGGAKSGETIVVAGEPCESVLIQKCSDAPPYGARMPLYGPYYTREELDLLHDWIAEGASDN